MKPKRLSLTLLLLLTGVALIYSFSLVAPSPLDYRSGVDRLVADSTQQTSLHARDAALVAEFQKRVQDYVTLHRRLEGPLPRLGVSDNATKICAAVEALNRELRAARITAREGDIFAGEIAELFRRMIREAYTTSETLDLLAEIVEEDPMPWAHARVNASYPEGAPLSLMRPKLLRVFPELPEELQYRFVNRDLILWDTHANLIVDFVPNAIALKET